MKKQNEYLKLAIKRVFTSTQHLGFWDEKKSRIHSKLIFDENWNWKVSSDYSDRYGVFTVTMILLAKYLNNLDISKYESKIMAYLDYIKKNISTYKLSVVTYGAFNALVLGQLLYGSKGEDYSDEIRTSYLSLKKAINVITNNEDALVLIGLNLYYKYMNKDEDILNYISRLVQSLLITQSKKGFFLTGDIRAVYHQRTMYVLWGLAFSSLNVFSKEIKVAIERTINYVWKYRRDGKDNAFIWHPFVYLIKTKFNLILPIISPYSGEYLFECHQTFFVNAIIFYQQFYDNTKFTEYIKKAMDWIFGENRIGRDLVTLTNIGVPTRIVSRKGELFIKNNNFKGSYEIGSYIFALSFPYSDYTDRNS